LFFTYSLTVSNALRANFAGRKFSKLENNREKKRRQRVDSNATEPPMIKTMVKRVQVKFNSGMCSCVLATKATAPSTKILYKPIARSAMLDNMSSPVLKPLLRNLMILTTSPPTAVGKKLFQNSPR